MPKRNNELEINLNRPSGYDFDEFVAELRRQESWGLRHYDDIKAGVADVREATHPRFGPGIAWSVYSNELGRGQGFRQCHAHFTNCVRCERKMVNWGIDGRCVYCDLDDTREKSALRSRLYRIRHGITKAPFIQECATCGKQFSPKRSTAKFCSTKCRVAAHRHGTAKQG